MTVKVALINPLLNNTKKRHKMSVPLKCKLITEDGKEIKGTMKKKGNYNNDDDNDDNNTNNSNEHNHSTSKRSKSKQQKQRPPLHYLQLHEDCASPKISCVTGECIVKFRINDVSQNHKNQGFHVVIQPNIDKLASLCEIYECRSSKIIVKSKSPEKLNAQSMSLSEISRNFWIFFTQQQTQNRKRKKTVIGQFV